ncbi:CheR family methyltransferase [Longirhabdus pacifica]|uniref:CheR family methyltransferase n=1 Tax=Longirhabdus pacifica TaxID=2305227 RepID=UPI00100872BF|nr:protein-glutamate O-methyltransferase CheR [Longirhabdus pacifica]
MDNLDFSLFVEKIKRITAIDLSQYKEAQMKRRITTLRDKRGYHTFDEYFLALSRDKNLLDEFLDRITINVSEFWRNVQRWNTLKDNFLVDMVKEKRQLKCWSAACSTGEEPYTLAMILDELNALHQSKIIASDLDENVLQVARKGVYDDRAIREMPEAYLNKYFSLKEGNHHISNVLKQKIRFEQKDLLVDEFEEQFDLIICRNVMIYFTDEAKDRLYRKFSNALREGGIFFVGSTEQIFSSNQYDLESLNTFFYQKKKA